MQQLIRKLSAINWADAQWRKYAADILLEQPCLPEDIMTQMREWDPIARAVKLNGSHETSTHYKWLIHRDVEFRFTLWLHDYKLAERRRPGYAEVPHNHRYDLCSMIVNGGYSSILYDVNGHVVEVDHETLKVGDVLSLSHNQVHSLADISEGTQSIFIEGPVKSNFSTAYPLDGPPCAYEDFEGRWDSLMTRLKGISLRT